MDAVRGNRHHFVALTLFGASLLAATLCAQTTTVTPNKASPGDATLSQGAADVAGSARARLPSSQADVTSLTSKAQLLTASLSEVVGTAVSPLLGMGLIGTVGYFRTASDARAALPWYNRPRFWVPILALLLLVFLKDSVGGAVPFLKKPLDAVELVENKVSALVASPIVVQQFVNTVMRLTNDGAEVACLWQRMFPVAHAADGALDSAVGGAIATVTQGVSAVAALSIFFVVFALAHVVNVLVLLSPFGPLDLLLKAARVAVIGIIASSSALNPVLGLAVCAIVIGLSMWLFGWSFRFTTFGSVMAWDLLFGSRADDASRGNTGYVVFASGRLAGVPARTLGSLRITPRGTLELVFRPFLVLRQRRVEVAATVAKLAIGRGALSPSLVETLANGGYRPLLRFSARYRGCEDAVRRGLGIERIRDISIGRGLRAALGWMRSVGTDGAGTIDSATRGQG